MSRVDKLIVTHRGALREKYGTAISRIEAALRALVTADAARDTVNGGWKPSSTTP